jgi:hypothetical protein
MDVLWNKLIADSEHVLLVYERSDHRPTRFRLRMSVAQLEARAHAD